MGVSPFQVSVSIIMELWLHCYARVLCHNVLYCFGNESLKCVK